MSVNDLIRDRIIRHDLGLNRYADSTVRKILGLLALSERDLVAQIRKRMGWIADRGYDASDFTLRRLEANLVEVRRVLRDAYLAAGKELRKDLIALAKTEAEANVSLITGALPTAIEARLSLVRLGAEELRAIVEARPFQGALLRDWARQLEQSAYTKVRSAIRVGMAAGESIDQIVRRVRGTSRARYRDGILSLTWRETETIVRTAVSHVAQTVREDTYSANADLIRSKVWLGTLDSRTCVSINGGPGCAQRDGKEYTLDGKPIGHQIPWGPGPGRLHHRDRCASIPRLKSWRELGFDREDLPESTRSSMSGQVPGSVTFGDWIKNQSAEVQNSVLGATRAAALRRGEIGFADLFDRRGNLLPVSRQATKWRAPIANPQPEAAFAGLSKRAAGHIAAAEQESRIFVTHERALLVSAAGGVVIDKRGGASSVSFSQSEITKMRGGVLTHNHPSGSSFSFADVGMFARSGVAELRAVGMLAPDRPVTYRLRPGSGSRPDSQTMVRAYLDQLKARDAKTKVDKLVADGMGFEEARRIVLREVTHAVMEALAKDFGLNYLRIVG